MAAWCQNVVVLGGFLVAVLVSKRGCFGRLFGGCFGGCLVAIRSVCGVEGGGLWWQGLWWRCMDWDEDMRFPCA